MSRRNLHRTALTAAALTAAMSCAPVALAQPNTRPDSRIPLSAMSSPSLSSLACSLPANADLNVTRKVYEIAQARNLPPVAKLAIFESGWVESHMNNLACGGEDSVGVFQLRAIHGSVQQRMNVQFATDWWINTANNLGINKYSDAGLLAADVERPAEQYRGRYGEAAATARNLMTQAMQPYGVIGKKYAALGGSGGSVGPLVRAEEAAKKGGRFQLFKNGIILWSPATGAFWVHGDILTKFWATNSETAWGFPTMDELSAHAAPDGTTGRYQYFQNGLFLWSQPTGTHIVHGEILKAFENGGREAALGYPTSDETDDGNGGRVQQFQNARIDWTASGGAVITKK